MAVKTHEITEAEPKGNFTESSNLVSGRCGWDPGWPSTTHTLEILSKKPYRLSLVREMCFSMRGVKPRKRGQTWNRIWKQCFFENTSITEGEPKGNRRKTEGP